jgi:SAM-dependent methyltransferase
MQYLFGDTDIAARRLEVLAKVFAPSTRAFLLETVKGKVGLALDLGCGPGYSTHFLADTLPCDQVSGFDNSEHFISLAQRTETENVSFHLHDVTSVPFPVGPADLLCCRFLLTHLKEPQGAIAKWATQLRSKGFLLMEEVESIHIENIVFETYIGIVEAMLEHGSSKLYIGPILNSLGDTDTLKRRVSKVRHLEVSNNRAATLFYLNMQSWKHPPFIRRNYSSSMLDQLESDLTKLTKKSSSKMEIEWGLRQIAYERV